MPERPQELELFREKFLHQLTTATPEMQGHQEFMRYWRAVEAEASQTEDLSKLENWVKDLARDKEQVQAVKSRLETMDERDPASEALLNILRMLLEFLEGVEKKIRRVRDDRRRILQALLWKGGPGVKPKPETGDEEKDEKKGDAAVQAALLAQQKGAQKTPEAKATEKKMQR